MATTKHIEGKKRLVLLDSHAILHRAYHALPDFATAKGEPTGALFGLSTMLISILEELKPDYVVACFDLKGPTYRHEAYKDYKAGRKKTDDALIAQIIRSRDIFTALNIPQYDKEGFEADDMLGTIVEQVTGEKVEKVKGKSKSKSNPSTLPPLNPATSVEVIIASGDMDTLQLVKGTDVKVYTLKKGIKDTIIYDEDAVRARFGFGPELIPDYKGLRGDPSDNIIGVKGIGEKTATILITNFGTIENMYKELGDSQISKAPSPKSPKSKKTSPEPSNISGDQKFLDTGITPRIIQLLRDNKEEAEFSKMLATIRRDAPINFVLPEKTFKEGLDIGAVKKLWTELEFRTLVQRLERVVTKNSESKDSKIQENRNIHAPSASSHFSKGDSGEGAPFSQSPLEKGGARRAEDFLADSRESGAAGSLFGPPIDPKQLEETLLALWVVNSNYTNPTIDDALNFANTDDFTAAREAIFLELDKRGLRKVYEDIELPLMPIVKKMDDRGVKIDKLLLNNLAKTYHKELSKLEKAIWKHAGLEFNVASPKQLGEVLFDKLGLTAKNMKKTGGGARSTKESELEKLRDLHPIVPLIFEYRELAKLLGTYIDAIPPLLDNNDRLHTHFIQTGSTTGRMASQNPGIQNIPIKTELGRAIREAFITEKGFKLVGLDYSQVELRIAAFLSGDEKLIDIFRKGEDVHTSVASFVFKVAPDKVTGDMRRQAKVINFGIIYGMGVVALQKNLGTSREDAQKFLNEYFATFSTLATYLDKVKSETARKGYTETFFGRRRYFEGINSKLPFIKAAAERMAINAPIQGTAADVVKLAMIKVDEYIQKEKLENDVFLLLQVHDELILEVKDGLEDRVSIDVEKIMESVMDLRDTQGVIIKAESAVGMNWGEI